MVVRWKDRHRLRREKEAGKEEIMDRGWIERSVKGHGEELSKRVGVGIQALLQEGVLETMTAVAVVTSHTV